MNKRTISMIQILNTPEKEVTIAELAEEFQISQRTVRNDLKDINELLRNNGLEELVLKSGGKIMRQQSFYHLLPLVSEVDLYSYKLSKEERKKIAAALLISATGYITLSTIADTLFVSRATVINDLDDIKAYIRKENLEVTSHPNKGLLVEGDESAKRRFLLKYLGNAGKHEQEIVANRISVQAGNRIVLQKIINEQEHAHKCFLTDASFHKILNYLGIMVNRNMQGEYIEPYYETLNSKMDRNCNVQGESFEPFSKNHDLRKKDNGNTYAGKRKSQWQIDESRYTMAQDILRYVSQYCSINTTEDEVRYLANMLASAKYMKYAATKQNSVKIQMITRRFVEAISEEIGVNLNGDYDFFESLSNHLESVLSKSSVNYPENPIIDEVLEDNPEIFEAVKKKLSILHQYVSREITEVELGYIAVHICAALERKKNKEIAFHVIVACHAGIGTSQLLLEKLKKHFNFQIVDVIASHEAANLTEDKADFIISTVNLENCKLDYVVVSPLLNDEDYIRVGNKIDTVRNSRHLPSRVNDKERTAKGLLEQLQPVVYETVPDMAPELMKKIRRVVRSYFNQSVEADGEIFSPYLHHLLPASHITLDVECTDWRDAIRKSAALLLERGYIEERYVDAMISNIEENGPYVILSPGFAVPHEGVEKGSVKVGMSLIRLRNPVKFCDEEASLEEISIEDTELDLEDYPVEFVCVLSAIDHKTHLKAFFNLVNMLQTEGFKEKLRACKTSQEAATIIEQYEYEL